MLQCRTRRFKLALNTCIAYSHSTFRLHSVPLTVPVRPQKIRGGKTHSAIFSLYRGTAIPRVLLHFNHCSSMSHSWAQGYTYHCRHHNTQSLIDFYRSTASSSDTNSMTLAVAACGFRVSQRVDNPYTIVVVTISLTLTPATEGMVYIPSGWFLQNSRTV